MAASMFDPYAPNPKSLPEDVTLQSHQLVEYVIPDNNPDQHQPLPQVETVAQAIKVSSEEIGSSTPDHEESEDPTLRGRKKYRSSRSVNSDATSCSTLSGYSKGKSPLDDRTFAPPPEDPTKSHFGSNSRVASMPHLPSFDMVTHSGNAMARISLKSLVMKRWKPIFWICYGDSRIIIFRSKNDFEEWLTNPHLSTSQREELIKSDIDFKDLTTKSGVRGYRAASLHMKDYGGRTGTMHTFKLEEWMYYGPIILGAFASKSRTDIHSFLVILREIMKRYKQNLSGMLHLSPSGGYDSDRSHYSSRSAPQYQRYG